jgi:spermidine synthase
MNFFACFISWLAGFVSLSLEILWVRLFSFANHSLPQAFSFVLIFFLLGIAGGAYIGKKFCENNFDLRWMIAMILLGSGVYDLWSPWIYVAYVDTSHQLYVASLLIMFCAMFKAILFPMTHHLGVNTKSAYMGRSISRVYVSNILGATIGPIITGIFLLNWLTTQQSFILMGSISLVVGLCCFVTLIKPVIVFTLSLLSVLSVGFLLHYNSHLLIEKAVMPMNKNVIDIVENQHGIITLYQDGLKGDIVFGGNVYDGRVNVNPVLNSNGINRVLMLAAIKPEAKHVLMIGLSIGSWLKLVTSFPSVTQIDVIEINPGYLQAMRNYPELLSGLQDKRVNLYIDDGRHWLSHHAEKKYDLIVMNTTYHWRAYISYLLSQEFLTLIKQHLNENGVVAYNSTSSVDAFKTAVTVFSHAYLYENFIVASDADWRKAYENPRAIQFLSALKWGQYSLFKPEDYPLIKRFLSVPLVSIDLVEAKFKNYPPEIIHDNNLVTEFKHGKALGGSAILMKFINPS